MPYDLFPEVEREATARANTNLGVGEPGVWTGFGKGVGMYGMRAAAEQPRSLSLLGAVLPIAYDKLTGSGTEHQDAYFAKHDETFNGAVDYWTPKPGEVGAAGQVVGSLVGSLPLMIANPALAVASTQLSTSEDLIHQGVTAGTAGTVGAVQAAALAAGIRLPYLGKTLASRVISGAAGNVAQGAAAAGLSARVLDVNDFPEQAKNFNPWDLQQRSIDLLMGAAFGGLAHLDAKAQAAELKKRELPQDVKDAVLVLNQSKHLEDTATAGKPATVEDLNKGVTAIKTAADQMLRGEPVDVEQITRDIKTVPDPAAIQARMEIEQEAARLGKAYDSVLIQPLGPVNEPIVRLTPEAIGDVLVERGPAWKKGEADIQAGGYGLVKFIWKHGEKSGKSPDMQVTREDVMRTPEVLRDYRPISDTTQPDGKRLMEWQVERADGKKVIYAVRRFADGDRQHHLVTLFVNDGKTQDIANKPLSEMTSRLPESPGAASKAIQSGDTNSGSFLYDHPSGQEGGVGNTIAPSGTDGKPVDPVVDTAQRIATERPDMQIPTGETDANGNPVTLSAADFMAHAAETARLTKADAGLFRTAITCLLGVL